MLFFTASFDLLATGEEHSIGGNTCLRSFHPHQFRMTDEGLIKQDDFCLALLQIRTGTKARDIGLYSYLQYFFLKGVVTVPATLVNNTV